MAAKREQSLTIKLSDEESLTLRKMAAEWDMEVSAVLRACMAVALPVLRDVDFVRRVRLEDNKLMKKGSNT